MQSQIIRNIIFAFLLPMAGCLPSLPVLAQALPDEQLLAAGRAGIAQGHYTEAVAALEKLRVEYPGSLRIADGSIALLQAYLSLHESAKAEGLLKELFRRWPSSETAYQAVETLYRETAKTDPDSAVERLREFIQGRQLAPDGMLKAQFLLFQYLETAKPADFLAEALPVIAAAKGSLPPADIRLAVNLARRVYKPLLAAGRAGEAAAITAYIQEALAMRQNPDRGIETDTLAYLQALAQYQPAQFLKEAHGVLALVDSIQNARDAGLPAETARMTYDPLYQSGGPEEAKALHEKMRSVLARVGNPDGLLQADTLAFLLAMERKDATGFLTAAPGEAARIKESRSPAEAIPLATLAGRLYAPLFLAGRADDARMLNSLVQTALARLGARTGTAPPEMLQDKNAFLAASVTTALTGGLDNALAQAKRVTFANESQAGMYIDLARKLYAPLVKADRREDARALHEAVQEALKKLGYDPRWETMDYLAAQPQPLTAELLTQALALAKTIQDAKNAGEVSLLVNYAGGLYAPLLTAGRGTEARELHTLVQAAIARLGGASALSCLCQYLAALQQAAPEEYLAETMAYLKTVKEIPTKADLNIPMSLAMQIYAPLGKAGRFAEAKAIHDMLVANQQRLGITPNPDEIYRYFFPLEAAKPDQFLVEALPTLALLRNPTDLEVAKRIQDLAMRVYPKLVAVDRYPEARALHEQVQRDLQPAAFAALRTTDTGCFLMLIWRSRRADFLAEAIPVIRAVASAKTADELRAPRSVTHDVYETLMVAKRGAEAKELHEIMQTALGKLSNRTDRLADLDDYVLLLARIDPQAFLAEALPLLERAAGTGTPEEWQNLVTPYFLERAYAVLVAGGQVDDAKALHGRLQDTLTRLGAPTLTQAELRAYLLAQASSPDGDFLNEALPIVTRGLQAASVDELAFPAQLARLAYSFLLQLHREEEAASLHRQMLEQYTKLHAPAAWTDADMLAYFTALAVNPARFLAEATPLLDAATSDAPPPALDVPVALAGLAYRCLKQLNRPEDARQLHGNFQRVLLKLNNPNNWVETDQKAYISAGWN